MTKELQALEILKDKKNHTNKEIGVHLNITTTIMGRIAKTLLFRKLNDYGKRIKGSNRAYAAIR